MAILELYVTAGPSSFWVSGQNATVSQKIPSPSPSPAQHAGLSATDQVRNPTVSAPRLLRTTVETNNGSQRNNVINGSAWPPSEIPARGRHQLEQFFHLPSDALEPLPHW